MNTSRQSFLGESSTEILADATVAIIGLGGGGSHVVQQLAHVGIGGFVLIDPDVIEKTNLNRLVGATERDVELGLSKVSIGERVVRGVNSAARVTAIQQKWQFCAETLRDCDIIVGCVDSFLGRDELERTARRYHLPYVDVGMDVLKSQDRFDIVGQVAVSLPAAACLHCMNVLRPELLRQEAEAYGMAGERPQVVWSNGVLASTAVGIVVQLLTPWQSSTFLPLLEYDGNSHELRAATSTSHVMAIACPHFVEVDDLGDPWFALG